MSDLAFDSGASHTKSLTIVWAVLVVLTLMSWWFRDHGLSPDMAVSAIVVISFVKVYLVGHSFMELKFAPKWLRLCFSSWCVGSCIVLTGLTYAL